MSAASDHVIAEHNVMAWCLGISDSIKNADIDAHMSLVSPNVRVYGIPGKDMLEYADWKARRQYEFKKAEVLALNYQKIRLISSTPRRIRFTTAETTVVKSGKMLIVDKNIILEHEQDGIWRVVEENINNWQLRTLNLSKY